MLAKIVELYSKKNKQYATDNDPLGNFHRCGAMASKILKPDNKSLAVCLAYISKQIDGVFEIVGEGKKDCPDELKDKLMDVAVYSIIATILNDEYGKK